MGLKELGNYFISVSPVIILTILLFQILNKINADDFMWLMFYLFTSYQIFSIATCAWANLIYED